MARKKKEVANPEADTVVDTVEIENVFVSELTTALVVRGSHTARTYTKEKHGDDFVELAKEYAANNGGQVVVR